MSDIEPKQSYVELFEVSKDEAVARAPLAEIPHLPRVGERVFLRHPTAGEWHSYTVLNIEYFLADSPAISEGPLQSPGMVRITLYVERNR